MQQEAQFTPHHVVRLVRILTCFFDCGQIAEPCLLFSEKGIAPCGVDSIDARAADFKTKNHLFETLVLLPIQLDPGDFDEVIDRTIRCLSDSPETRQRQVQLTQENQRCPVKPR